LIKLALTKTNISSLKQTLILLTSREFPQFLEGYFLINGSKAESCCG